MKKYCTALAASFLLLASCGGSSESSDTTLSDREEFAEAIKNDESTTTVKQDRTETDDGRPIVTIPNEFDDPQDEILATYNAYHEALLVGMGKPEVNPDYEPLFELVVDPEASNLRDVMVEFQDEGHVVIDPSNSETSHSVRFVGAFNPEKTEGNTVTLIDCHVDATEIRTLDGKIVNDEVVTFAKAVEMKVVDGAWKFSAQEVKERYEGVNECEEYANV